MGRCAAFSKGVPWAKALDTSSHAIWRILRKEGISLSRQRSWCISTDKEFTAKAVDIVGLYLDPPMKAVVLSVDEKPSIQALVHGTPLEKGKQGTLKLKMAKP